jgi:transposase
MDLPYQGITPAFTYSRKRYRCKDCGGTFFHPLSCLDDSHRATKRFVDRIATLALERNFSDIAWEYGISEHGVRTIFYGRHIRSGLRTWASKNVHRLLGVGSVGW